MSILKGILHHWNKTTQSYDTIHPETEVARVTDWNQGIVNTLASTGLSSLVNVLSSDSLLALLIKKVFDATGVKYSLGQNGYVCFGSFYGGLIIQWGINKKGAVSFPIAFTKFSRIVCFHNGEYFNYAKSNTDSPLTGFTLDVKDASSGVSGTDAGWIALGL